MTPHRSRIMLVFSVYGADRECLRGIYEYARPGRPWDFFQVKLSEARQEKYAKHVADAGIGSLILPEDVDEMRRRGIPFVNLCPWTLDAGFPHVGVDERAVGRMAARHLADRGFEHFGLYQDAGISGECVGFRQELARRGHTADGFRRRRDYPEVDAELTRGFPDEQKVMDWLAGLPKPVGIFALGDMRARWLTEACAALGLNVPEQVAVLGRGDDDLECNMSWPQLSSVRVPYRLIGYRAAQVLDHLLRGEAPPEAPILLPPEGVRVRRSTDTLAIGDGNLVRAIRHIREHACEHLSVSDVVGQTSLSRRVLENRFRNVLGRSIFREIRRVQVERAKHLLRHTNRTVDSIAREAGFGDGFAFSRQFARTEGMPPGAWRRQFQRE